MVGVASQLARCQTLTGVRLLVACDRVPVLCVMRLTRTEEGTVFRLWINENTPERAIKYIPESLLPISGQCYIRIINVVDKKATLGVYWTREAAVADTDGQQCVELLAPPVTAATISHMGIKYIDGKGWVESIQGDEGDAAPLLSDGGFPPLSQLSGGDNPYALRRRKERAPSDSSEDASENSSEESERSDQKQAADSSSRGLPSGESRGESFEGGSPPRVSGAMAEVSSLTGIRDEGALRRLVEECGLDCEDNVQMLTEQGAEFARAVGVAAQLSLFDTQRLMNFVQSKGGASGGALGSAGMAMRPSEAGPRARRKAVAGARKTVSFLESIGSEDGGASASSGEEYEAARAPVAAAVSRREPAQMCRNAGSVGVASRVAAAEGAESSGVGGGERGGEAAILLANVPRRCWPRVSEECIELLIPALTQREPRGPERRRAVTQLQVWLRAAAAKGVKITALHPGGEEGVLEAVQEACAQLEVGGTAPHEGRTGRQGVLWAEECSTFPTMMMGASSGAASADRLDDERAVMESMSYVAKHREVEQRIDELAGRSPSDGSVAAAAAALGGIDKLRPLVYMSAGAIQAPAGMIASPMSMRLISNVKRVRALIVALMAELLRRLLPSAGTKADTAAKLAEAIWTGALVSKFKLSELFQPSGGSMLLAGGGKKAKEQAPTELFARGINMLSVAYQTAHGSFDTTVAETFGVLFSSFLDATQKQIEPARAAAFVVEPVLCELERQWKRATSGLQEKRPVIGEVAAALRPQMLQTLSVEVAVAAAYERSEESPVGKAKEAKAGKSKGGAREASVESLQRAVEQLQKGLGNGPGAKAGGEQKSKRKGWREKMEAWELANSGKCWYVENQTGGCTRGRECQNWYEGHPEAPKK